jgi:hypothetical protein
MIQSACSPVLHRVCALLLNRALHSSSGLCTGPIPQTSSWENVDVYRSRPLRTWAPNRIFGISESRGASSRKRNRPPAFMNSLLPKAELGAGTSTTISSSMSCRVRRKVRIALRRRSCFYCFRADSMAATTSGESGVVAGSKRETGLPLRSKMNLVKFHLMSPPMVGLAVLSVRYR